MFKKLKEKYYSFSTYAILLNYTPIWFFELIVQPFYDYIIVPIELFENRIIKTWQYYKFMKANPDYIGDHLLKTIGFKLLDARKDAIFELESTEEIDKMIDLIKHITTYQYYISDALLTTLHENEILYLYKKQEECSEKDKELFFSLLKDNIEYL